MPCNPDIPSIILTDEPRRSRTQRSHSLPPLTLSTVKANGKSALNPEEEGLEEEKRISRTSILINNLHCSSCISHIKELLEPFDSQIIDMAPNILNHEVVIRHSTDLFASRIYEKLQDGEFELDSAISEVEKGEGSRRPRPGFRTRSHQQNDIVQFDRRQQEGWLEQAGNRWNNNGIPSYYNNGPGPSAPSQAYGGNPYRNKHISNCDSCQEETLGPDGYPLDSKGEKRPSFLHYDPNVGINVRNLGKSPQPFRASRWSIWSSWTGKDQYPRSPLREDGTPVLDQRPVPIPKDAMAYNKGSPSREVDDYLDARYPSAMPVDNSRLTARTQSSFYATAVPPPLFAPPTSGLRPTSVYDAPASVFHRGSLIGLAKSGYDEEKKSDIPFVVVEDVDAKSNDASFIASLSIGGMTCAVCTGAVTRGVQEFPWLKSINVNLLTNSASVEFPGPKSRVDEIVEKIEDLGYDCSVESCDAIKVPAKKNMNKRRSQLKPVASTGPAQFEASLSIGGMTCAVCTGAVTRGVNEFAWIKKVDVNLLTNSAQVVWEGPKERVDELVEKIEDLGYDCSIESCGQVKGTGAAKQKAARDGPVQYRTTLSIGGMTCAVCTGAVTRGLQELPYVKQIDINLLTHSGTVVFEGKDKLAAIIEKVDDLGYDCSEDNTVEIRDAADDDDDEEEILERTMMVKIEGMYCEHCPARILEALRQRFPSELAVEREPTLKDPIVKFTYIPQAPLFTIRSIIATIIAVDEKFSAAVYHPPSLEERSHAMHQREQRRILLRLAMCVILAIPTFLFGILWMSLVPETNRIRKYMEEAMWVGSVSRVDWALLFLSTPVMFFAADIFHKRAIKEIRALWRKGSNVPILRRFYRFGSMNLLMSTGTSIAYFSSIAMLIMAATQKQHMMMGATTTYFDSVVFLTMFILIGRFLEAYSKAKTGDAVTMLGKLRPTEAILMVDRPVSESSSESSAYDLKTELVSQKINVDLLEAGDIVKVPHGASPPADGIVVVGETKFDESSLTGESRPVNKAEGDEVFSGTTNQGKVVSIRVKGVSGDSMLDQIVKVVREGQTKRAPVERIADILTGYFVPVITLIAILTFITWFSLGQSGALPADWLDTATGGWPVWALEFAIAVFVVACPCGIGLAAPTALFVGSGLAAQHGILVKGGGEAFQEASALDCIVFDKTGTLTEGGNPVVTDHDILVSGLADQKLVWAITKSMEESSNHPIARAIVKLCETKQCMTLSGADVEEVAGRGLKGTFMSSGPEGSSSYEAVIGNEAFMRMIGCRVDRSWRFNVEKWKTEGKSVALLALKRISGKGLSEFFDQGFVLVAQFATADPLRPEAPSVVKKLQESGIGVWMLSGDNQITAEAVGLMVGIPASNVIAGVLPDQKAEKIQYLQKTAPKRGQHGIMQPKPKEGDKPHRAIVAMVGDGINDSPALTMADVGIAIGSGSDVAIGSAKFVLVSSELQALLTLTDLSRAVFRRVKFNFGWALVYNCCALPVAAGVLYPLHGHPRLNPIFASLAMAMR
jgi:P-type Cu+ transporter